MRDPIGRLSAYLTSWACLEDVTAAAIIWLVVVKALQWPYWSALVIAIFAGFWINPVRVFILRNITERTHTTMGWSDGNDIFDRQATEYLRAELDPTTLYRLAFILVDALQEQDWDTESESLTKFRTHLPIVAAFYNNGINNTVNETDTAHLEYNPDTNEWSLTCNTCHTHVASAPFTVEGHDHLLNLWSFHDIATHSGDGKLDWDDMFLTPTNDDQPAMLTAQVAGMVVSFPRDWSLDGSDGSDPNRFVLEFTRPAPADHPDIVTLSAADVALIQQATSTVAATDDVATDDDEEATP